MSRSVKKNVYVKDSNTFMKRLSHHRLRREVKRRIFRGDWDVMPVAKELTNQWDVCDWRWYLSKDDDYYEKCRRK
jgi:hypothetical protein